MSFMNGFGRSWPFTGFLFRCGRGRFTASCTTNSPLFSSEESTATHTYGLWLSPRLLRHNSNHTFNEKTLTLFATLWIPFGLVRKYVLLEEIGPGSPSRMLKTISCCCL